MILLSVEFSFPLWPQALRRAAMPPHRALSLDAQSALDRFDARLRASASATLMLEQWLAERGGAAGAKLSAHLRAVVAPREDASILRRLGVADWPQLSYRRVWLASRGRVMSVAENWYVGARLGEGMVDALASGATPFGAVITPLSPTRETLNAEKLWGGEGGSLPPALLRHHALVRAGDGAPLCEVREVYTRNILI